MEFDHVKDNFLPTADDGANMNITWIRGKKLKPNRSLTWNGY